MKHDFMARAAQIIDKIGTEITVDILQAELKEYYAELEEYFKEEHHKAITRARDSAYDKGYDDGYDDGYNNLL